MKIYQESKYLILYSWQGTILVFDFKKFKNLRPKVINLDQGEVILNFLFDPYYRYISILTRN